jgi:hypothetical protein
VNIAFRLSLSSEDSTRIRCRFGRSFLDVASLVLHLTLVVFGCSCTAVWVGPSLFALCCAEAQDLEVFHVQSRSPMTLRSPTPALSCTSETGSEFLGLLCLPHDPPLCTGFSLSRLARPKPNAALLPQRLLEVCRPSGGVIAGVRNTRDYHPWHLPPLVFLRPSTACTSRQLACSVSHRHHLWDSKKNERCSLHSSYS